MSRYETREFMGEILQWFVTAAGMYLLILSISACIRDWQEGIGNSYESTRFAVDLIKAGIFAAFTICWIRYRL